MTTERQKTVRFFCVPVIIGILFGTSSPSVADPAGDFDLYVLSLSWSPAYCATHQDDAAQCASDKHFGLVVHGLWPQFDQPRRSTDGGKVVNWPSNCHSTVDGTPPITAMAVWPSPDLYRHEWQVHGTCSGLSPTDYVDLAAKLRQRFQLPATLLPGATDHKINVVTLRSSIINANPDLPPDGLALYCRRYQLAEIRLCLTHDGNHAYRNCPSAMSNEGSCPGTIMIRGFQD